MPESGRSNDGIVISVESLSPLSSLEVSHSWPRSRCIFKTPSILFRHKENAFLPNYFSIGPMRYRQENLVASEKIKIMYLNELLSRVTTSRWPEVDQKSKEIKQWEIFTELKNAVKLVEKKASACYAGHDFAAELGDKFVEVMVLDGCFIIELFRKNAEEVPTEPDDPIFSTSCMLQFLSHDLILLENQIPWFVLQTLFEKTTLPSETESLIELTLLFFASTFSSKPPPIKRNLFSGVVINHILDLLWLSLILPSKVKDEQNSEWQPIPTITGLQEAGVKFKRVRPDSILDISFKNGTLEIPSLLIQETTETILRNLIAYEQCLPNCRPYFTNYAMLLDNLIDTPNDLDILCKMDVCDNRLTPEDATQFFNKLCYDTYIKEFYYRKLREDLNRHCECCCHKLRAYFMHHYFSKPWAIAAIYAFMILALTFWQTFVREG